ncbi:hypothetical protein [Novosphingopyxis sp. YJ-S2-01]|nr:hypothetical protein [Novosphingopyxis sp. YJ-S2-01]
MPKLGVLLLAGALLGLAGCAEQSESGHKEKPTYSIPVPLA